MEDVFINMAVSVILGAIKNPAKAATLKAALLKIRNAINNAFPDSVA